MRGGVCQRHGAKPKPCSVTGCNNQSKRGGVCVRHGAAHRKCNHIGCTLKAIRGGVCRRHGADPITCSFEGGLCTNIAKQKGGFCITHGGAKRGACSRDGCDKLAIKGGVCTRHGTKVTTAGEIDGGIDSNDVNIDIIVPSLPPLLLLPRDDESPAVDGGEDSYSSPADESTHDKDRNDGMASARGSQNNAIMTEENEHSSSVCGVATAKDAEKDADIESVGKAMDSSSGSIAMIDNDRNNTGDNVGGHDESSPAVEDMPLITHIAHPKKQPRKRKKRSNLEDGTTTQVKEGEFFGMHVEEIDSTSAKDAPRKRAAHDKICTFEGCTNLSKKQGFCSKHCAKGDTQCTFEGCTKWARKGGVCRSHGAKQLPPQECSHDGCTNHAVKGGVCRRHGAKVKRTQCSHEGCTNWTQSKGFCCTHGGSRPSISICKHEGCTNISHKQGRCELHTEKRDICSHEGCTNVAHKRDPRKRGLCQKHGGYVKLCKQEGCTNINQRGGFCHVHGAGAKKTCGVENCSNFAVRVGILCKRHYRDRPWTDEEKSLYSKGVHEEGLNNWGRIASDFVTTRTPHQIREYARDNT